MSNAISMNPACQRGTTSGTWRGFSGTMRSAIRKTSDNLLAKKNAVDTHW
jgi:hypothetical protein